MMKIKSDFITNSSSSSFIVVFDKQITKFEDVKNLISKNAKAEQVLIDSLKQTPKKIKRDDIELINMLTTEMYSGHYIDANNELTYSEYQKTFCEREGITQTELYKNTAWTKSFYNEYAYICRKVYSKKVVEFLEEHDGNYLYIFHYGDDEGEFFSEMEHGGTFEQVPHIRISKH